MLLSQMMLAPLVGAALIFSVATDPTFEPNSTSNNLSNAQKNVAMQKFVRTATDCIARTIASDPRYRSQDDLGDLIVDAMPICLGPLHAMIDVYDRYFGEGTGEAFFMGAYLDALPTAVTRWMADRAE